MTETILALDLGTKLGWALRNENGIVGGTVKFVPGRYEGGGMRYLRFQRWLADVARDGLQEIVFEEVRRHAATDAAHVYGGLLGVLTAWCESRNIPYRGIPVGTIKKFWAGKGNASKEEMCWEAVHRGFPPEDDNHADALALLHFAMKDADQ